MTVSEKEVEAAAVVLLGRVNAPEQEIYAAARAALEAAASARADVPVGDGREAVLDLKSKLRVAFRKALSDLPEIAPDEISSVLSSVHMRDEFHIEGKRLQRKHGLAAVRPRLEQECGAGAWSFMRQGIRSALVSAPAQEEWSRLRRVSEIAHEAAISDRLPASKARQIFADIVTLSECFGAAPASPEDCLTNDEQMAQGKRCSCGGSDDYCPCQNVPDRETRRARAAIAIIRPAVLEEAAKWHEKNARYCREIAADEPRIAADGRQKAKAAATHHDASATGLRTLKVSRS